MSESDDDNKNFGVDVAGAALLGVFTCLAAYAAYQASLWGGNQATAYTEAINILGEANRELLRGVQDQSFDTTVWIEQMKAADAARKATAAAEATADEAADGAAEAEEDDEEELTREQRARQLAEELAYVEDEPIAKQLTKVMQSRRELVAAVKWSEEQHEKRTKLLPPQKRLELANALVTLFDKSEAIDEEWDGAVKELGLKEADEDELELALEKDPAAKERFAKLEQDSLATQTAIDAEMEKLAAPMFFESPTYTRSRESRVTTLLDRGNQTFLDGQRFNTISDRFTLTTVFYTVALFFAGMSAVMRQRSIKLVFLAASVLVAGGALWYMLNTPFA